MESCHVNVFQRSRISVKDWRRGIRKVQRVTEGTGIERRLIQELQRLTQRRRCRDRAVDVRGTVGNCVKVRAIEIGQKPIAKNVFLVQVETTHEVVALPVNVANLDGRLPADLALDTEGEFIRARHMQLRIDGKDGSEISCQSVILRICAWYHQRGCRKRRCAGETRVQTRSRERGCQTGVLGESIVSRANELVIYETSPITTTQYRAAFAGSDAIQEFILERGRPGKAHHRGEVVLIGPEKVLAVAINSKKVVSAIWIEHGCSHVAPAQYWFQNQPICLAHRYE